LKAVYKGCYEKLKIGKKFSFCGTPSKEKTFPEKKKKGGHKNARIRSLSSSEKEGIRLTSGTASSKTTLNRVALGRPALIPPGSHGGEGVSKRQEGLERVSSLL